MNSTFNKHITSNLAQYLVIRRKTLTALTEWVGYSVESVTPVAQHDMDRLMRVTR